MARAVTEPHPLWEKIHAPMIRFQETLESGKLFGQVFVSFVMYCLGWWFLSPGPEQFQKQNWYQKMFMLSLYPCANYFPFLDLSFL
jgi:bacteriorhodopsin